MTETAVQLQPDQRHCPRCNAVIKRNAGRCRYCQKMFSVGEILAANPRPEADRQASIKIAKILAYILGAFAFLIFVAIMMGVKLDPVSKPESEFASHCASPWDGSIRSVIDHTKAQMRDPASFEHVETKITRLQNGVRSVLMTYRGRNGFGGMNVETTLVDIKESDCSIVG